MILYIHATLNTLHGYKMTGASLRFQMFVILIAYKHFVDLNNFLQKSSSPCMTLEKYIMPLFFQNTYLFTLSKEYCIYPYYCSYHKHYRIKTYHVFHAWLPVNELESVAKSN